MQADPLLSLRLNAMSFGGEGIVLFDFVDCLGGPLPAAEPGAHITVSIPTGAERQYSLLETGASLKRYRIAVLREVNGRGGSKWLHDNARIGQIFQIGAPRNHFPLNEKATHSVFVAGGIGITPLIPMINRLRQLDSSWELHFFVRSRSCALFEAELSLLPQVRLHVSDERNGPRASLKSLLADVTADAEFYCCGPESLMQSFESDLSGRSSARLHTERFTNSAEAATSGGFSVVLAKSGREIVVAPGKTILDALLDAGVDSAYSCKEGTCGMCEVRIIDGIPDHRDAVLSEQDRQKNRSMMICVSGCKSDRLVLDC